MAEEIIPGGGRAPKKRGIFRRWGKRFLWVVTLGAASYGAVKHGPGAYDRFAYRNDPSVVAASSEKRAGVRKARAVQDEAIKVRDAFLQHVEETYKPSRFRGGNKKLIKKKMMKKKRIK